MERKTQAKPSNSNTVAREPISRLADERSLKTNVKLFKHPVTRHFTHLRSGDSVTDRSMLLTVILADAINLLGFRFAPRLRDLADRRLYTAENAKSYPMLVPFIGGTISLKQLFAQWSEILRLACSIRLSTVTSSLILRKLASYPRQNGLALAPREFGLHRARRVARVPVTLKEVTLAAVFEVGAHLRQGGQHGHVTAGLPLGVPQMDLG
jgi:hypothetical protein